MLLERNSSKILLMVFLMVARKTSKQIIVISFNKVGIKSHPYIDNNINVSHISNT